MPNLTGCLSFSLGCQFDFGFVPLCFPLKNIQRYLISSLFIIQYFYQWYSSTHANTEMVVTDLYGASPCRGSGLLY